MTQVTCFSPMFQYYTPWERQVYCRFDGGVEVEHSAKIV